MGCGCFPLALIVSLAISLVLSMVFHTFIFLGVFPLLFLPFAFGRRRRMF